MKKLCGMVLVICMLFTANAALAEEAEGDGAAVRKTVLDVLFDREYKSIYDNAVHQLRIDAVADSESFNEYIDAIYDLQAELDDRWRAVSATANAKDMTQGRKERLKSFLLGLDQFIVTPTDQKAPERWDGQARFSCFSGSSGGEGKHFETLLTLTDDVLFFSDRRYIQKEAYLLDDQKGFLEYLRSFIYDVTTINYNRPSKAFCKFDPKTAILTEYAYGDNRTTQCRQIDSLEFDVTVTGDFYDTLFEELADVGDTIHLKMDQYSVDAASRLFILTLKGPKGEAERFLIDDSIASPMGPNMMYDSAALFSAYYEYVSGGELFDGYTPGRRSDQMIKIWGDAASGSLSTVYLLYSVGSTGTSYNKEDAAAYNEEIKTGRKRPPVITGENISYQAFKDSKGNLVDRFGQTRGTDDPEPSATPSASASPTATPGNPNWTEKNLRSGADDFRVDFAGTARLKLDGKNAPDWLDALGDSPKVTVVGIMQTREGKDRLAYPMLKFEGAKGTLWFDMAELVRAVMGDEVNPKVKDAKSIYAGFQSAVSFSGFTIIKDTVDFEEISMEIRFTDETKSVLESLVLHLADGCDVTIPADEINYIGGGKAVYDTWGA